MKQKIRLRQAIGLLIVLVSLAFADRPVIAIIGIIAGLVITLRAKKSVEARAKLDAELSRQFVVPAPEIPAEQLPPEPEIVQKEPEIVQKEPKKSWLDSLQETEYTRRQKRIAENKRNGVACCPKCGSTSLSVNKKGYSFVKGVLITPLGGTIGMNKLKVTCLNCGHTFKPGR